MKTDRDYYIVIAKKNEPLNVLTRKKKMVEDSEESFNMVDFKTIADEVSDGSKINIRDIADMMHFSVSDIKNNNTTKMVVSVKKGVNMKDNTLKAVELFVNSDQKHQEECKEKDIKTYQKLEKAWEKCQCLVCQFIYPIEMKNLALIDRMNPEGVSAELISDEKMQALAVLDSMDIEQTWTDMALGICVKKGKETYNKALEYIKGLNEALEEYRLELAKELYNKARIVVEQDV